MVHLFSQNKNKNKTKELFGSIWADLDILQRTVGNSGRKVRQTWIEIKGSFFVKLRCYSGDATSSRVVASLLSKPRIRSDRWLGNDTRFCLHACRSANKI